MYVQAKALTKTTKHQLTQFSNLPTKKPMNQALSSQKTLTVT
jgi:hypothetical protein